MFAAYTLRLHSIHPEYQMQGLQHWEAWPRQSISYGSTNKPLSCFSSDIGRHTLRRAALPQWPQEGAVKSKQTGGGVCSLLEWAHRQMSWGVRKEVDVKRNRMKTWVRRLDDRSNRLTWRWAPGVSWSALPLHCPYPGSWRWSGPGTQQYKSIKALCDACFNQSYTKNPISYYYYYYQ